MSQSFIDHVQQTLATIKAEGLYKQERLIESPQAARVNTRINSELKPLLNLCANNYLGFANHPDLIHEAKQALDSHGFGMASVRFICGTQDIHKALERKVSAFLGTEDCILFSSCFDANAGVFETLLTDEDAIISDSLNHASIIDGVRLCKAARYRYGNNDMGDLERCLRQASGARFRLVVTDGVFSMDGIIAKLAQVCDLAEQYDAMVMVDDSHAVGFMGSRGAGTPDHCGVEGRLQLLSGTFGKALGGASGGYIAGSAPVVALLRQRARPYLFSNSVAPAIVAATIKAIDMIEQGVELRQKLKDNAAYFRQRLSSAGFNLVTGQHPIIPVMTGDAVKAQALAEQLMDHGVYVTAFSYPVVPKGQARVRTQMSAAHSQEQLDQAVTAFITVGKDLGLI
ncbi:MAG: glycine C-acetyltransferase [Gammaproteobacteria bacterium]|nr:glycine C-acetyltransferase [Gammaproteobacteria bacterium]